MADQPKGESQPATTTVAVQNNEDNQVNSNVSATDWLVERYRKIKEHAETYPYVWGSYIVVYGGFGLWYTYRWRKLRKTEDRVRALQRRLRELVEAEESSCSASSVEKASNSTNPVKASSSPEKPLQ